MGAGGSLIELRVGPELGFVIDGWPAEHQATLHEFFVHYLQPQRARPATILPITVGALIDQDLFAGQLVLQLPELELRHLGERLLIRCPGFDASCDTVRGSAWIAPACPSNDNVELFVTTVLPALLAELARPLGWQLMHAAAIARSGAGVLLPGPSGCGKSTITRDAAAAGFDVLSDDLVWLVTGEENTRLAAFPRGGLGDEAPPCTRDEATLAAVVTPAIGNHETSCMTACSITEILPELLAQAGLPLATWSSGGAFTEIVRAITTVPCYRLQAGRHRITTIELLNRLSSQLQS